MILRARAPETAAIGRFAVCVGECLRGCMRSSLGANRLAADVVADAMKRASRSETRPAAWNLVGVAQTACPAPGARGACGSCRAEP